MNVFSRGSATRRRRPGRWFPAFAVLLLLLPATSGAACDLSGAWKNTRPDGTSTWVFTSLGGDRYSAQEQGLGNAVGTAMVSGSEIRLDFKTSSDSGYHRWAFAPGNVSDIIGCGVANGSGMDLGTGFRYASRLERLTPLPPPGGGGICADPRTQAIMDEWLAQANPPENQQPRWNVRYDSWGWLVGTSPTATLSGLPWGVDTKLTRCEYLWSIAATLSSTNLGTMKSYVEQRLR